MLLDYNLLVCPFCNEKETEKIQLIRTGEILLCPSCSRNFSIRKNVPLLAESIPLEDDSDDLSERSESRTKFYEEHYFNRSRLKDIKSNYLMDERNFVEDFIGSHNITGYCLEIGCGTGIFADVSDKYIGLDFSPSSVFAEGFGSYSRLVASAERVPLKSQSVDVLFSFNTLEHIPDPRLAFREIDRLLTPGGYALLKPAWHCTRYNTQLIPVKRYSDLDMWGKFTKLLLPLIKSKLFKLLTRVPKRILRHFFTLLLGKAGRTELNFRPLTPYMGKDIFIADCDATADIDCHEAILWFATRGYDVISHKKFSRKILAGADMLVVRKSGLVNSGLV